jgi:glutathione synthase
MKILIAGEPTRMMQLGLDTGVVLAAEMLRRKFDVDYVDLEPVDWKVETLEYFFHLPVQKLVEVKPDQLEPFVLEKKRQAKMEDYSVIWNRLDPPVNDRYIGHMQHFSKLQSNILQINNPNWNWRLSEHLLPQNYPEFSVPTWECDSIEMFISTVHQSKTEVVAKPLHLYSGLGISFFKPTESDEKLRQYWGLWKPKVVVQPYLAEVESIGDLRILAMNRKVIGSVLRKPKLGSRLANLHQGGSAHFFAPTKKQLKACEVVANDLYSKGLYLLGIDFIGDFLTEVNITCPSALPQINRVMNIQGEKRVIDEMEALVRG